MQWIKIFTSIFGNPKIQLLLKERDGDTIFRIWIQFESSFCLNWPYGKDK